QLQKALIPVTKMVIKFGLQCHEFKDNIEIAYIQAAKELLQEENRTITNQAIAVKTGIDRRKVAEYNQTSGNKKGFNKMDLVILALQKCKAGGQKSLSSARLSQIIDSIYGQHIRAKAIIKELIHAEMITPDNSRYRITDALHQKLSVQAKLADEVDVTTQRLFETFYKKMFGENGDLLTQQTVQSSQIPPRKQLQVQKSLNHQLIQFQQTMEQILNDNKANVPEGTYPKIGFSQFQFNDHSTHQNE
ncbi:MAG: hypothetical protein OQK49_05580, partial [Proteobacteria bacterium]|nr:hypothetical protein [Pseudomonadota bacterium]